MEIKSEEIKESNSPLVLEVSQQEDEINLSMKVLISALFLQWFPLFISQLLSTFSDFLCTRIISSHFEDKYVDAAGLGWTITFMIGVIPIFGMNSALDTLVSQASGRKDYKECIRILFIATISIFVTSIGTTMVFIFGKQAIYLFEKDTEVVELTSRYLITIIPDVFIKNQGTLLSMFMFAQLIYIPSMIISIFFNLLNPFLCNILVINLKLGYLGVVYSSIIRDCGILIGNTLYLIISSNFTKIRIKFELFFWKSWKAYLSLGIPAIFLSILENWSYMLLSLFIGRLGKEYLAANVILSNIFACLYMLPYSIGYGLVSLVGNSLGENNPLKSKAYIKIGLIKAAILAIIVIIPLYIIRNGIAQFCFTEPEIIEIFLGTFPICLIFLLIETMNTCFQMSLIGMGKQIISSICGICGYGTFCLIFGYIFIFKLKYKDKGFWMATSIGSVVSMITAIIIMACSDFSKIAKKASKNIEK